jgi:hypothetical protein
MIKITGVKKACTEINNNRRLYNRVMYDTGDGTVWVDSFPSCNSWNEYRSGTIHNVGNIPEGIWDNYAHVSMAEIHEMVYRTLAECGEERQ